MNSQSGVWNVVGWMFGVVFLVLGVLNALLVHIAPGVFYIVLSSFYFPPATAFVTNKLRFSIPPIVTLILGLVVLWATLAVGELVELL